MRFCTWNVKSLYRSGSHSTVARDLETYKLDLVSVPDIRRDTRGTVRTWDYIFYGKGNEIVNWEQDFLYATEKHQQLRQQSLIVTGHHI